MIPRFNDYEQTKSYGDYVQLPKGGYVLEIKGAEICDGRKGQYIKIMCDVAEGEYKGYFMSQYCELPKESRKWHCNYLLNIPLDDGSVEDGWTKRRFKTVTEALEDSNAGYHFDWDERKFKGKLIGGLFNEREYFGKDGKTHKTTNLAQLCATEKIRSGNYIVPKDKLLSGAQANTTPAEQEEEWINIPDSVYEDVPFN